MPVVVVVVVGLDTDQRAPHARDAPLVRRRHRVDAVRQHSPLHVPASKLRQRALSALANVNFMCHPQHERECRFDGDKESCDDSGVTATATAATTATTAAAVAAVAITTIATLRRANDSCEVLDADCPRV